MSDLQAIADRVEIEALRGEFTDAVMMHDYDRLASLFTQDGTVLLPHAYAGAVGREDMRAGGEQLQALLDFMVQTTHPGRPTIHRPSSEAPAQVPEANDTRTAGLHRTSSSASRTRSARQPISCTSTSSPAGNCPTGTRSAAARRGTVNAPPHCASKLKTQDTSIPDRKFAA